MSSPNAFFSKIGEIHIKYLDYLDDQMMQGLQASFARDEYRQLVVGALRNSIPVILDDIDGQPVGRLSIINDEIRIIPI